MDQRLPEEYEKCLVGINSILKEAWNTSKQENIDNKEKIQALSLAKECYSMRLDLLTNATVVDDAIRFVSCDRSKDKEKLRSSSKNNEEEKESKEPDYDEDEDQLEEKQEELTGQTTINQVF